ncbi:hypothetical protein QR685DRAFT_539980 [Neurospora intermedia]|uniref:Uncharacterized protein n=1 Tax=Neurospora intermedia TaxID=5142 RepID=A0ABR3DP75_NEUIN
MQGYRPYIPGVVNDEDKMIADDIGGDMDKVVKREAVGMDKPGGHNPVNAESFNTLAHIIICGNCCLWSHTWVAAIVATSPVVGYGHTAYWLSKQVNMPQSHAVATLSSKETGDESVIDHTWMAEGVFVMSMKCLVGTLMAEPSRTPDPDPRPDYSAVPKIGRDYFLLTSFKPPEPHPKTGGVHRPPRTD